MKSLVSFPASSGDYPTTGQLWSIDLGYFGNRASLAFIDPRSLWLVPSHPWRHASLKHVRRLSMRWLAILRIYTRILLQPDLRHLIHADSRYFGRWKDHKQ